MFLETCVTEEQVIFCTLRYFYFKLCSAEQSGLSNFGQRQNEEHFCEIILNQCSIIFGPMV